MVSMAARLVRLKVSLFFVGLVIVAGAGSAYIRLSAPPADLLSALDASSDIHGKVIHRLQGTQKFTIVNFWASWCGPCIQETPSLFAFASQHPELIQLISISVDDTITDLNKFIRLYPNASSSNIQVLFDSGRHLANRFKVVQYPETLIYRDSRTPFQRIPGAVDWNAREVRALFGLTEN
jgi:thiol-disulfide isomerase/thioredoxin